MKRLGLYVIISIMLFGVFGGFTHPEKSFAAITQTDVDKMTGDILNAINSIPNIKATDQPLMVKLNLLDIANTQFDSIGGNQDTTPSYFNNLLLKKFLTVLQNLVQNSSSADRSYLILVADQNVVLGLKNNSDIADSIARGADVTQASTTNAESKTIIAKASAGIQKQLTKKCTSFFDSFLDCMDVGYVWLIKSILLQIAGFLVWLSANMLNLVIKLGILGFSDWAPNTLYPIWIIVRQIISLFIVFAGLWLGFMYIIGRDDKFKQYFPWVIIFALFVNFSYPLSRALIDISNVISLNVYSSAISPDVLNNNGAKDADTAGALIMNKLGLQGLAMSATAVADSAGTNKGDGMLGAINSTPGALLAVVYVFYTAYIFMIATILLATRTAVLVFLIVASPILFVDSVIPQLGEQAVKLRKMFFEQLVVAPVFMIMLALTLKFLDVFKTSGALSGAGGANNALQSAASTTAASNVSVFFNILMMLIMLHIMLAVTKKVSGEAGQMATNVMGKVGGFAVGGAAGLALGGAGLLGREGIGRAAAGLRKSEWVTNNQDKWHGRLAYNMTNSLANSTFDARNTKTIGGNMTKYGMGMGAGAKGGYDSDLKNKIDDRNARFGRIKSVNKDGTRNEEGEEAKARFVNRAGGVLLDKDQVRESLEDKLKLDNKAREKALVNEYSELPSGTIAEQGARQEFFGKQDETAQNKMLGQDQAEARAMNKEHDSEKNAVVANYAKEKDATKRQAIFAGQTSDTSGVTSETQKRMIEEDNKRAEKTAKEAAENKYRQDTIDANNKLAEAQLAMAEATKNNGNSGNGSGNTTTQTSEPLPAGHTTSAGGIIVPERPSSARPQAFHERMRDNPPAVHVVGSGPVSGKAA